MAKEQFKAAAAQIEPVYHDLEATIDKTCQWIERAGKQDVDIVVFPESHVPGYPYWRGGEIHRWSELMVDLQKNSLSVDDEYMEILEDTIAEADVHVVLGVNELSDRPGSETIYNSLFYFDRSGELVRRHRKLMPTHEERTIWGRGDPSSLTTHSSDIGEIGGLICYENHMTLPKAALSAMGEEIHPAVWPGFWTQEGHPGRKTKAESVDAIETCDQYPAVREYAFETQTFVISTSSFISEDAVETFGGAEEFKDADNIGFDFAQGGSMLVNPAGIVKEGPVLGEETLLTTTFDWDERRATKAYFDAVGHYARWDAVNLNVKDTTFAPVDQPRDEPHRKRLSSAEIGEIANEYDVSTEMVEDIIETLSSE
jgi:amidase/nitrilase